MPLGLMTVLVLVLFSYLLLMNYCRFMGLVAQFLQDGEAMAVKTAGDGNYVVAFRTLEVYKEFKRQFESRLVFRDDDCRYTWDLLSYSLDISWLL